jgi:hypothetical protein
MLRDTLMRCSHFDLMFVVWQEQCLLWIEMLHELGKQKNNIRL